ncbi:hypothetical protein AM588_10001127 [Phytophthora nicotianae]|uniref:non-specific serine/threonine protein kinase n=1 Tax=Phytophthora nicotianae TaxID=4792 RepID=A0A0W8CQ49_PHYNI|nr:hypothetical protein AM588_10001127 [Phytophthora nicotianae]
MKLDVTAMRYLTKEHFRVLTAIENGHEEPRGGARELITSIANCVMVVAAHHGLGRQIGVGKESDIYLATQEDGTEVAIKFHRLGRTSFRAVKSKRDYLKNRKSVSWFYMSRLSAMKEYAFLKALYDRDFPTPTPIDCNRHAICMSLVDGYPLNQVRRLANSKDAYDTAMSIVVRLAEYGLVHCDFNEFNIMIGDDGKITMIDFPQMISTSHPNAAELFDRDVHGLRVPKLKDIVADENVRLDEDVEASGFGKEFGEKVHDLSIFSAHQNVEESDSDDDNEDESEEESEGEEEDGDAEVPDLVQGVEATTLDDQADGSEEEISGEVDDEEAQDSFAVENEIIKQRVQRDRQARQKAGGKRRSRNSAKLSIKGKLYHKNDW